MESSEIRREINYGLFLGEVIDTTSPRTNKGGQTTAPDSSERLKANYESGSASQTGRQNSMLIKIPGGEKLTIDYPSETPDDPTLRFKDYMSRAPVPNFKKQRSKATLLNDAIKELNDSRFEVIHDISDWNGKYQSKIGQPFG